MVCILPTGVKCFVIRVLSAVYQNEKNSWFSLNVTEFECSYKWSAPLSWIEAVIKKENKFWNDSLSCYKSYYLRYVQKCVRNR